MSNFTRVIDGIWHWSSHHEGIGHTVHSYFLEEQRIAIDPLVDDRSMAELGARGGAELVVLTNRHHLRGAAQLVDAYGCEVTAPAPGMAEFGEQDPVVQPYLWGDHLAEGVTAHEVGAICPDDGALHIGVGPGALAMADGLIRWDGHLAFVPDQLMDEPEQVKPKQIEALTELLELDFDVLLLAHGEPIASGGKQALVEFVADPGSANFSG